MKGFFCMYQYSLCTSVSQWTLWMVSLAQEVLLKCQSLQTLA